MILKMLGIRERGPHGSKDIDIGILEKSSARYRQCCGGIGTDSTVPTNIVQVPVLITTGTVTDSG